MKVEKGEEKKNSIAIENETLHPLSGFRCT
jgi:hypothetical protein